MARTRPIHLVWHARTHADPAQQAFRALLVRSLPKRGAGRK